VYTDFGRFYGAYRLELTRCDESTGYPARGRSCDPGHSEGFFAMGTEIIHAKSDRSILSFSRPGGVRLPAPLDPFKSTEVLGPNLYDVSVAKVIRSHLNRN
jgi:hypothetical protein